MRTFRVAQLFVLAAVLVSASAGGDAQTTRQSSGDAITRYGELALAFESVRGRAHGDSRFRSRGRGYSLSLTRAGAVLALDSGVLASESRRNIDADGAPTSPIATHVPGNGGARVHLRFVDVDPDAALSGEALLPGKVNYLYGRDPKRWRTHIPTFARVRHTAVYPGVDVVYQGKGQRLEYDLIVAPGASIAPIRIAFEGIEGIALDDHGTLVLNTPGGMLRQPRPTVYQEIDGLRRLIAGNYVLDDNGHVGFRVAAYDTGQPLIIDPVLDYASYFGGGRHDEGLAIAVDAAGNAYMAGSTGSRDLATFAEAQPTHGGGVGDAFVMKLSPDGGTLLYVTYLGGSRWDDARGIDIDSDGNAYITGVTASRHDFPIVNAFQPYYGGGFTDAFIVKLDPSGGALAYATYLGGPWGDAGQAIAVDDDGNAHVTGHTGSRWRFPLENAVQSRFGGGFFDAFVTKLEASGQTLGYSTFLGGRSIDDGLGIAVGGEGNAYVTGYSASRHDFPRTHALQPDFGGGPSDAFITAIDVNGESLVYSTFLGGNSADSGHAVTVDADGRATITGSTSSATDFPLHDAAQSRYGGGRSDAFVTRLLADGSALSYSTYLGGTGKDAAFGVDIDSEDGVYVAGITRSGTDFPTEDAVQSKYGGGFADAFLSKLTSDGDDIAWSTYFGGSRFDQATGVAVDDAGNATIAGFTSSHGGLPLQGALQPLHGGGLSDAFIARFDADNQSPTITSVPVAAAVAGELYTYDVKAEDDDDDTLTFSLTVFPTGMVIDDESGSIRWTPGGDVDAGVDVEVTVEVSDGKGGLDDQTFHISVTIPNATPRITSMPITEATVGLRYRYDVQAEDADSGDTLRFALLTAPTAMLIDAASGLIQWTPDTEGTVTVAVSVDDGRGGSDTQSFDIQVVRDLDPPIIGFDTPIDGLITSDPALTIRGTLDEVAALTINDTPVTVDTGTLAFGFGPIVLSEGANPFTLVATDGVGNVTTLTVTITLDTVAPGIAIMGPLDGTLTSDGQVVVTGVVSEPATVTVNGAPASVDAAGKFTSEPIGLVEGANTLTVIATDRAGNAASLAITATRDTTPPVLVITGPVDGSVTNSAALSFTGAVDEPATVSVAGLSLDVAPGASFSLAPLTLVEGPNPLTVIATDGAGNSSSVSLSVTLDTVPPDLSVSEPLPVSLTSDPVQHFAGSVSGASTLSVGAETVTPVPDGAFGRDLTLDEGDNSVAIIAKDLAGNAAEVIVAITLDSLAPASPVASRITRGLVMGRRAALAGGAGSVEGGARVSIVNLRNGDSVLTVAADDGSFGAALQGDSGDSFSVTATDVAGNESVAVVLTPVTVTELSLNPIGGKAALVGQTLRFTVTANAPPGVEATLMVSPVPLPAGARFDMGTGAFEYAATADQVGGFALTFSADSAGDRDSETITVTVSTAGGGVTSVTGRVITAGERPLANVRVEMGGIETLTDATGNFALSGVPGGRQRLLLDGSTVPAVLGTFATVPEVIAIIAGTENRVEPPIVLLPLDVANADMLDSSTTSVIDSAPVEKDGEVFAPITLTVPPGRAFVAGTGEPFNGEVHITRIADPEMGPRPLPEDIGLSVYMAMQPFGVVYEPPVPISFPNIEGFPPESVLDFFALNHDSGEFEKIGEGTVSANGKTIDSIGGVVKSNSWHGIVPQAPVHQLADSEFALAQLAKQRQSAMCGSDFGLKSGNLSEDHRLVAYRSLETDRSLRLVYNSTNANPRPIIATETTIGNFTPPPLSMSSRLSVAGIDQGFEIFMAPGLEPGPTRRSFAPTRPAIQFHASPYPTGIHAFSLVQDCRFPVSRRSSTITDNVIIQNDGESPFGAGWTLAGLQRIHPSAGGDVLLTTGDGAGLVFTALGGGVFDSPPGDFSTLAQNPDRSFTRTLKGGTRLEFDADGQQTAVVDRNGNRTAFAYDSKGRLAIITDPTGLETRFVYNLLSDRVETITDPADRITRFLHDDEGNLIKITDPDASERLFDYEPGTHLLLAQTGKRGFDKEYTYDFAGRIAGATREDASIATLSPADVLGLVDTATGIGTADDLAPAALGPDGVESVLVDGNNARSAMKTDGLGAVLSVTDQIARQTDVARDADANPTTITRPNGAVVDLAYDGRGNVLTLTERFNGAETRFTYDPAFNLVTSVTNPRDNTTRFDRDARGNVIRIVNALGHTATFEYDARGLVTRMVDPIGLETSFAYNAKALVTTITETPPAGRGSPRMTRFAYDDAGDLAQSVSPDGITLAMTYDANGRILTLTDSLNQRIEFTYDDAGNVINADTVDPDDTLVRTVESVFDVRGRLHETRLPNLTDLESVTQLSYDGNGNLIDLTDPRDNALGNIYDAVNRLIENTDRADGVTRFEYDSLDRITRVTAPNGAATDFTYDPLGRRLTEQSPDRGKLTFTYDLNDNVETITDARGIQVRFAYDALDRVETITYPTPAENITFTYDTCALGTGRLCARADESGEAVFDFDAFGNITETTRTELGIPYTTHYAYDAGDNVVAMTYPSGREIIIARDVLRRIERIEAIVNGAPVAVVSNVIYRADNRLTRREFGNGLVDARSYDLQSRLTRQTLAVTAVPLDERQYAYDPNGNLISRARTPTTSDYVYDPLDRLTDETTTGETEAFGYDPNGNRLTRTRTVGIDETYTFTPETNRLTRIRTVEFANELLAPTPDRQLVYNDVGRLAELIEAGVTQATYTYNADGQRTRKATATATVVYHYGLAGRLIAETRDDGTPIRDYVWQGQTPTAQIDNNGALDIVSYLHSDHLFTTRLATDALARVVWTWEGDAFGTAVPDEDPDLNLAQTVINLRFPGQYFDAETGLHYNYFRDYDPSIGRYIQSDPIGLAGGINSYSYVGVNPIRYDDRFGLESFDGRDLGALVPTGAVFFEGTINALLLSFQASTDRRAGVNRLRFLEAGLTIAVCERPICPAPSSSFAQTPGERVTNTFSSPVAIPVNISALKLSGISVGIDFRPDGTQCFVFGPNVGPPLNQTMPLNSFQDRTGEIFTGS